MPDDMHHPPKHCCRPHIPPPATAPLNGSAPPQNPAQEWLEECDIVQDVDLATNMAFPLSVLMF